MSDAWPLDRVPSCGKAPQQQRGLGCVAFAFHANPPSNPITMSAASATQRRRTLQELFLISARIVCHSKSSPTAGRKHERAAARNLPHRSGATLDHLVHVAPLTRSPSVCTRGTHRGPLRMPYLCFWSQATDEPSSLDDQAWDAAQALLLWGRGE